MKSLEYLKKKTKQSSIINLHVPITHPPKNISPLIHYPILILFASKSLESYIFSYPLDLMTERLYGKTSNFWGREGSIKQFKKIIDLQ